MKHVLILLWVGPMFCGGCAIYNRDNTRVLNWFEDNLLPKENPAKVLSYPVMIPAGLVSVAIDGIIVHPVSCVDDALRDTRDICWRHFDWDNQYVTECAQLLPRTIFTPFVAAGSFIFRSLFDIPPNDGKGRSRERRVTRLPPEPEPSPVQVERPIPPAPIPRVPKLKRFFRRNPAPLVGVSVLLLDDPPVWLLRDVPNSRQRQRRFADALAIESHMLRSERALPSESEQVFWVILRGPQDSLIVLLDEYGLCIDNGHAGDDIRFDNPVLEEMLRELLADERPGPQPQKPASRPAGQD